MAAKSANYLSPSESVWFMVAVEKEKNRKITMKNFKKLRQIQLSNHRKGSLMSDILLNIIVKMKRRPEIICL